MIKKSYLKSNFQSYLSNRLVKFLSQLNPTLPQEAASSRTIQVYMADKVKYDGVPAQMGDGKINFCVEY